MDSPPTYLDSLALHPVVVVAAPASPPPPSARPARNLLPLLVPLLLAPLSILLLLTLGSASDMAGSFGFVKVSKLLVLNLRPRSLQPRPDPQAEANTRGVVWLPIYFMQSLDPPAVTRCHPLSTQFPPIIRASLYSGCTRVRRTSRHHGLGSWG
jgi:hypothetical protein